MGKNYKELVHSIVENVGGIENIQSAGHCMTRLRFVLHDAQKMDKEKITKQEGVLKLIHADGQEQIVIGTHVGDVYKTLLEEYPALDGKFVGEKSEKNSEEGDRKKKNSFLDIISSIFMPVITGMMAAGIIKGLLVMCTTLGWLSAESDIYTVFYAASDAFFYFLPLALAISSAKKFECNPYIAFAAMATLVYPNLMAAMSSESGIHLFGLKVTNISYTSTVIPAIVSVWVLSKIEKFLKKVIPEIVKGIFVPMLSLVIIVPLVLLVIGPVTDWIGQTIATGYTALYSLNPPIAGMLMAALNPLLIIIGAHGALFPVALNNMTLRGYDTLAPASTGNNYAMAGAALAVALKSKKKEVKQVGFSAAFAALVGGITEPAIYGVALKYKKPFYFSLIFIGLGGLVAGLAGSATPVFISTCILTLPTQATFQGGWGFVAAAAIGFFGTFITTWLFGYSDEAAEE